MLFCDFDGTLAPIVERPEMAMMSGKLKSLIQSLAQQPRFTISIVSGRSLSDLRKRVGIKELIYAGNHGMEIEGPGIRFVERSAMKARPTLRLMHRLLTQALGEVKGTMVEDKGLTLSIHYRQADEEDEERVKSIFNNVVDNARSLGEIRVTAGKKVLEVRPAVNWDKGRALVF
ncbi:MAG: trehalose-phosphatase, partial [Chloroflexi bacterium]|nr:trehalose-phosphatase [Chloroflexota bacterium]